MKDKINIVQFLKDCPKDMELDCTMYEDVYFDYVDELNIIHCYIKNEGFETSITFNQHGTPNSNIKSKCVIFPKGKTTWEGFVPPCRFKDGDVVVTTLDNIAIIRKPIGKELSYVHGIMVDNSFYKEETAKVFVKRLANEEEKQKLFDAIKANGYKWNPKTKTLEKLIEPKFKVGDRVKQKNGVEQGVILSITDDIYDISVTNNIGTFVPITNQDKWELVPNKFDINTLVPFESRVLVRAVDNQFWRPAIWGVKHRDWDFCCVVGGEMWEQCIPYEGNEHLLGTANDCNEYYKIWE